jgi:hypothetical protein
MNNTALVRIKKEFDLIKNDPPENFNAFPIKVTNIYLCNRMIYLLGILQLEEQRRRTSKMEFITGSLSSQLPTPSNLLT